MRDLLNGIYNKVLSFFSTIKDEEGSASKETACNRLKLVLMHDRAGLSESTLQMMRSELIEVISKYMEIDTEALDLKLETEGESIALMLGIPVIRAKSEEEIQEAIEASNNSKEEISVDENAGGEESQDKDNVCTQEDNPEEEASIENIKVSEEFNETPEDDAGCNKDTTDETIEKKDEIPSSKKSKKKNK